MKADFDKALPRTLAYEGHQESELVHAPARRGTVGPAARRTQEWLCLHGLKIAVDGEFGPATEHAVREFQGRGGLAPSGIVDVDTGAALAAPLRRALETPRIVPDGIGQTVVTVAAQHLAERPREVGGPNCGPWVRLYTGGHEGKEWAWCAAFGCSILRQACGLHDVPLPLDLSFRVTNLVTFARLADRFVNGDAAAPDPGDFFVLRAVSHTGIVIAVHPDVIEAIEGNSNPGGSREGTEVCRRIRARRGMDYLRWGRA